jgi:hypothetical protein
MAVTYYSRYKFVTASIMKRLRNGRFNCETAVRRFQNQKRNGYLDPEVVKKNPLELLERSRYNSFIKAETTGVVIEIFVK